MNIIKTILILICGLPMINCQGMQEWIRTSLQNIGLTQPQLAPTQELRQIIEREGTFKNTGLKKLQGLIGSQADVNVVAQGGTHVGKTPLLVAIADYQPSNVPTDEYLIVRLIAEYAKADINKRYVQGFTPLSVAAYEGKASLIPLLLRFGADIKTRDDQGNTPLLLVARLARPADQQNVLATAKQLLDAGIDINAKNNLGETALYRAVQRKNYALITFLVQSGADASLANNQGQTPLALAQANNDQQAIDLLTPKTQRI